MVLPGRAPYRGLAPFRETDHDLFFGRRAATLASVGHLAQRLTGTGGLLVYGVTGAGKSSLIHAGLLPALARGSLTTGSQDWPRIVLTPTDRPLDEMCAHLAQISGSDITAVREALRSKPGQIRLYARQAVRDCLEVGCGV